MAYIDTDIVLHIIRISDDIRIGHNSRYTSQVHPGTNKQIEGWKWDERHWSTENEREAISFAPTIWDPDLEPLDDSLFQSGYGDSNDLLLLNLEEVQVSGYSIWAPKINHGYFYVREEEWYLFSDQHRTENVLLSNVVSGIQYHQLSEIPKPTIPIYVQNYTFDFSSNRYVVDTRVKKRVEFTTSGLEPEFIVDTDLLPPQLVFSGLMNEAVGGAVAGTTDNTDPDDISALEVIGYSNGTTSQEFFTTYSPIDRSQPVEVWSWYHTVSGQEWTLISGLEDFTNGDNKEAYIDYDRGIVRFGDYSLDTLSGAGHIPAINSAIGIYYTKGFETKYEPINSVDYILTHSDDVNINPLFAGISNGFIQVKTSLPDPASVVLSSTLVRENPFLISLGNFTGTLTAEVTDSLGVGVDGQGVTFEILSPTLGTFGGVSTTVDSVTSSEGVASTLYHAPPSVDTLGRTATTGNITIGGGQSIIQFTGLTDPGTVSGIYLYKVHTYDEVLGIAESDIETYFSDYLASEGIVEPDKATREYEELFREYYGLDSPTTYASDDYSTGKKTIVMTTRPAGVMHPHEGTESSSALVPLFPSAVSNVGTDEEPVLSATYETELTAPGVGDTRAYFGVADAIARVRAYVIHPRTGKRIYSNTISVKVSLPSTVNGTFFADALSDIPDGLLTKHFDISSISDNSIIAVSGIDDDIDQEYYLDRFVVSGITETFEDWFRRTRVGDTRGLNQLSEDLSDPTLSGIIEVEPQTPTGESVIPLGFRLKSSTITAASVLDQITYVDPNDILTSGIFNVDY